MRTQGPVVRRFLLKIVFLNLFCLLPHGQSLAALTDQAITATPEGIHIQVQEHALGEVLRHIQQQSGIQFSFPHQMGTTPITATIAAPDWPTAIRQLLQPFSTAEVWDHSGKQLSKVFIIERGQAANPTDERAPSSSEDESQKPEDADKSSIPPPSASSLPLPPQLPPPPPASP